MQVLLFDMMQTLVAEPFYDAIDVVLKKSGVSFDDCRKYRNAESFLAFERGEIGEPAHFQSFYLENTPVEMQTRLPHPRKLKKEMMRRVRLLPGIDTMLDALQEFQKEQISQSIELGIASNYSIWYQDIFECIPGMEDRFDYLFFSCELGMRKPEASYYDTIHRSLCHVHPELLASDIFFADDRTENLRRPEELGWQTHLMESVTELHTACLKFLRNDNSG